MLVFMELGSIDIACIGEKMEANINNIEKITNIFTESAANIGLRILIAIVIYFVGKFVIRKLVGGLSKIKGLEKVDPTVRNYIMNFVKVALYVLLVVSIVAQLGVPMASVVAVIATAGAAIGLAMQGALANIAGGLMLLIFRPFSVGDYIVAGSDEGTVKSISLVYTVLTTVDNRIVSIPNGSLMNSSVTNASSERQRRVDLSFDISSAEDTDKVQKVLLGVIGTCESVLDKPEPRAVPFEPVPGGIKYHVRAWVKTKDYWDVHDELMEKIPPTLKAAKIEPAAAPVKVNK